MWRDDDELFALMRSKLFPRWWATSSTRWDSCTSSLAPQIRPLKPDMVVIGRAIAGARGQLLCGHRARRQERAVAQAVRPAVRGARRLAAQRGLRGHRLRAAVRVVGRPDDHTRVTLKARRAPCSTATRATRPRCSSSGCRCFRTAATRRTRGPRGKVVDWRVAVEMKRAHRARRHRVRRPRRRAGDSACGGRRRQSAARSRRPGTENRVRDAIRDGMSTLDAFKTFGVM